MEVAGTVERLDNRPEGAASDPLLLGGMGKKVVRKPCGVLL